MRIVDSFSDTLVIILFIASIIVILFLIFKIISIFNNIYKDLDERNELDYWFFTTEQFVKKELGYSISISAFRGIRGGKTMTMCGLGHVLTEIVQEKCMNYIGWFRSIFVELDYDIITLIIVSCNEYKMTIKEIADKVEKVCPKNYFLGTYDDHISKRPKRGLLEDYIEDQIALINQDITWSNVYFHNRVTGKDSKRFEDGDFDLKDIYKNGNYVLQRNSVYLIDEETLGDRQAQNFAKLNKEDKGRDILYRIFGQMMKEKSYIVTTAQKSSRIYKNLRELYNSFIEIQNFKVKGQLNYAISLVQIVESWSYKLSLLRRKFIFNKAKKALYDERFNWGKARQRALDDIINYFDSGNYMVVNANVCHREDFVGKEADGNRVVNFDFVFPIRYVFGVYDTHYFKFIHEVLMKNGTSKRGRIARSLDEKDKEVEAETILSKDSDEEDEGEDY